MRVNIAFSSDNNYAPFLCTAIFSLLKNSYSKNKYYIYILDGGITIENKNKILSSLNQFKNKKINFINIDQKIFKNIIPFLHINQTSFYRLLLPEIIKTNKIIYLDCDLLILKDISQLYRIKLNKKIIGCCQIFHPNYHKILHLLHPKVKTSINAGVTLMDLQKLRKNNYSKIFLEFTNKNSKNLIAGDQDVLNIVLSDNIKIIHPKWNSTSYIFVTNDFQKCHLSQKDFEICTKTPSIVHFDGIKPWNSGSQHPYKKTFYNYLQQTEFKDYKTKFNFQKFIKNQIFYNGNKVANLLPLPIYNFIEKQYLKKNFIEKSYQQIIKNENN